MPQVGCLLLICTFFFDIFWVFLSPLIFKKSVMIEAPIERERERGERNTGMNRVFNRNQSYLGTARSSGIRRLRREVALVKRCKKLSWFQSQLHGCSARPGGAHDRE